MEGGTPVSLTLFCLLGWGEQFRSAMNPNMQSHPRTGFKHQRNSDCRLDSAELWSWRHLLPLIEYTQVYHSNSRRRHWRPLCWTSVLYLKLRRQYSHLLALFQDLGDSSVSKNPNPPPKKMHSCYMQVKKKKIQILLNQPQACASHSQRRKRRNGSGRDHLEIHRGTESVSQSLAWDWASSGMKGFPLCLEF